MEGADRVPFATGKKSGTPHDVLFWRNRTRSNNYSARQGEWKFVHSTEGSQQPLISSGGTTGGEVETTLPFAIIQTAP